MLYRDIKREVLGHINQYSIAGAQVSPSYNNQADYLARIPQLINEGLVNVRTLVKPEPVVLQLDPEAMAPERLGDLLRFKLPDDFWSLRTGGFSVVEDGRFKKTAQYRLQGKQYVLVPAKSGGIYILEYYKYPEQLPLNPEDTYELQEDLEVIQAATYYAAANLVMLEDEFAYASLYNDYESRLTRISPGITAELQPVEDVYAFGHECGGYLV